MNDATVTGTYQLVSALFVRLLGAVYLIAFASIGVQIEGLIGSNGIEPLATRLNEVAQTTGIERFAQIPTLFWLDASDAMITGVAGAGCLAAVLVLLNLAVRPALVAAFALYLSLFHAAQPFLNFQWDTLLLEAGFLAIFLTPRSRMVIWLFRWLLFRLRFESGLSKLVSDDPAWSGLTALDTYFEVQPLPNPVAWYAHQLPDWLLKVGTGGTLFVELVVPFMMFLPRRWRFVAAWLTIFWQLLILLTSNHNWINLLTIILCLFLFDDRAVKRVLPGWLHWLLNSPLPAAPAAVPFRAIATGLLGAFIFSASALKLYELGTSERFSGALGTALNYAAVYSVANVYHVFPSMTTQRIELEILGSSDGSNWKPYHFRYRPDALDARPGFIIPHQPRLDWQIWFVTLHPRHMPWFVNFLDALLENSPAVKGLLANDPFPDTAPRYVRVDAYRYQFTDFEERRQTGNWWKRTTLGSFTPLPLLERREATHQ
jgi:hypothetical protein